MQETLQIRRIQNEVKELRNNPPSNFHAAPLENDLRSWHFTIRGAVGSEFENGLYHGKIDLPSEYPLKPPNIYFLTPNGRFEVNTTICLSITRYHPENWNPAYTIRTMIEGIINHFPVQEDFQGIGSLQYSKNDRIKMAKNSKSWKCSICGPIIDILPDLQDEMKQSNEQNNLNGEKQIEIQQEDLNNKRIQNESQINDNEINKEPYFNDDNKESLINNNSEIKQEAQNYDNEKEQQNDDLMINESKYYNNETQFNDNKTKDFNLTRSQENMEIMKKNFDLQSRQQILIEQKLMRNQMIYSKAVDSIRYFTNPLSIQEKMNKSNQQKIKTEKVDAKNDVRSIDIFILFLVCCLIFLMNELLD